jgi:hypothetical protein
MAMMLLYRHRSAGDSNTTKVVYFPMALDPAPLTWLESLSNNSIDSQEGLKKVFIDNFQGAIARAGYSS